MTRELKIFVAGTSATGKSAIAELIHQTLSNVGIVSSIFDDNGIGIVDERPGVIVESLHERLASIRQKGTEIKIRTQQLLKHSL